MRYRVYDMEDKKEHIIDCTTKLEVGTTRRVNIRKNGKIEIHHFRVLEQLPENK